MRQKRKYYQPIDIGGDGSWHFYIPEKDGPPGQMGDLLVGPYYSHDDCYRDAMSAWCRVTPNPKEA